MQAYNKLSDHFSDLSHFDHMQAILSWDEAVNMPAGGGAARAEAMATLAALRHQKLCLPALQGWVAAAASESLDDWQKVNLELMRRNIKDAQCVPADLVKASTTAQIRTEQAWRACRSENNWQDFLPLLSESFALCQQVAECRAAAFDLSPYDALIDKYSQGVTQASIDPVFTELKNNLPALLEKIVEKQSHWQTLEPQGPFAVEKQQALCRALMQTIGFDFNHGRMDVSHHPFCGGVPQDVRITTRYDENDFMQSVMGICHETGHAKYEQQLPEQWGTQPVGAALGMAMHESQSLLIEMQACRSKAFMQYLQTVLPTYFTDSPAYAADNLAKLYTRVKPGLIRVDADEVTYPLHVVLRYELEQALFDGSLKIADLPEAWDAKMQSYLGLSTQGNFKEGVLQDVHWPAGLYGYFPSYTLGALTAAQLYQTAEKNLPTLGADLAKGDFSALQTWLRDNIHQQGSRYYFDELLQRVTGEKLNVSYFLNHIEQRYL